MRARARARPGAEQAHAYSSLGIQLERREGRRGRGREGRKVEGEGRRKPKEQPRLCSAPNAARCRVAGQLERARSSPALFSAAGDRDARRGERLPGKKSQEGATRDTSRGFKSSLSTAALGGKKSLSTDNFLAALHPLCFLHDCKCGSSAEMWYPPAPFQLPP